MEPTNQKHLYHLLMQSMEKLAAGEMKVTEAREMSNLGARMNTAAKLEHDRVRVLIEAETHKQANPSTKAILRNIEGKNFD